ncbi:MAG: outer membrane beta-barrel protein [Chitinophagaceae bacterium]
MQRFLSFLVLLLSFSLTAAAQQTRVTFKVLNAQGAPQPFATVTVINVPDSVNKEEKLADSSGAAVFQLLQDRPYRVQASAAEYAPAEMTLTVKGDNPVYTLVVEAKATSLSTVVVTASRPLLRQEDDKTIVDPEGLANSSTNAYEIMEKVPGLFVDQDGNIYLNSTTPATVYINGREQKISAADIATMLKSLPPNSIASIEILRTPSARYDASGSGGIVNVVLKKGVRIGLTGSVTTGFNQGRYGNRFAGFNLNNNSGRLTTYFNFQYSRRKTFDSLQTTRFFGGDTALSQVAETIYPTASFYTGFGASYELSKKWEVAYDGRYSLNHSRNSSTNLSQIVKQSNGQQLQSNEALVANKGRNFNLSNSISLKYKIDSAGSEWITDLSHTYAPNHTDQHLSTFIYTPLLQPAESEGTFDNKLQFFSAQTNFIKKLPRKLTLETGIKGTWVKFSNNTDYFNMSNGTAVKNVARSGAYRYTENINAAYVQASKTAFGITLKLGTRMENTTMEGRQLQPKDTSFLLNRTDFFPYVYLSRSLMEIAGYDVRAYLVYRRTISRPAYEYLNPSIRVVDPYLFETGNPGLRPQFTNNYEANISVTERPIFAIGYNDTKDIFTQVVYPSDSNRLSRTYDNLGSNKETYFRAIGAIPPGKRYFFVVGAQYNHNFYNGLIEGNKPLEFKRGSWSLFTYQTFKVTPLTTFSFNGFVRFNGMMQFYELSSFGSLRMSLSQQFFNKKLTATLSAEDLFYTNQYHFELAQGSVAAAGFRKSDTRRFGLNLRYNFGLRRKEEANLFNIESPERAN